MTKGKFMVARKQDFLILAVFIAFSLVHSALAELVEYPWAPGLVYDTDQNITWLKDANYAKTSGYRDDGRMHWKGAMEWAENLVYESGGIIYDDWSLPITDPQVSGDCSTSGISESEMGHLCCIDGVTSSSSDAFINVQPYWGYWSSTRHPTWFPPTSWGFHFKYGYQDAM